MFWFKKKKKAAGVAQRDLELTVNAIADKNNKKAASSSRDADKAAQHLNNLLGKNGFTITISGAAGGKH